MTFGFGRMTVTTWGRDPGQEQVWRARLGDVVAYFKASRLAPENELKEQGWQALGQRGVLEPDGYGPNPKP
jgi:hypothetical protein